MTCVPIKMDDYEELKSIGSFSCYRVNKTKLTKCRVMYV